AEKSKQERPAGKAARTPPLLSPELHPDGRVTFRLRAADAHEVKVSGEGGGGARAMSRDENGVWTLTARPLRPDVSGQRSECAGFQPLARANPAVKPMRSPRTSILEVPGDPPRLHEFQNVPHGTVRIHQYRSRSLGRLRALHVYTPPGYDQET